VAGDPYSIHGLVASSTVNLWDVQCGSMKKPEKPDPEGTRYFRATYTLAEGTDANLYRAERDIWLNDMLKEKKLRSAGAYVDDPLAGLLILSAPSIDEANAIMKEDPYVKELGADYQVIQWDPKFGEFK